MRFSHNRATRTTVPLIGKNFSPAITANTVVSHVIEHLILRKLRRKPCLASRMLLLPTSNPSEAALRCRQQHAPRYPCNIIIPKRCSTTPFTHCSSPNFPYAVPNSCLWFAVDICCRDFATCCAFHMQATLYNISFLKAWVVSCQL